MLVEKNLRIAADTLVSGAPRDSELSGSLPLCLDEFINILPVFFPALMALPLAPGLCHGRNSCILFLKGLVTFGIQLIKSPCDLSSLMVPRSCDCVGNLTFSCC